MTPSLLQDALANELERLFGSKTYNSQAGEQTKLKIFKQFAPLDKYGDSTEIFPYMIILAATFDDNEDNQGYKDLLNILEDISQHLRTNTTLDKRYRLTYPLKGAISEDVYPYFFGAIEASWTLPNMYGFKGEMNT